MRILQNSLLMAELVLVVSAASTTPLVSTATAAEPVIKLAGGLEGDWNLISWTANGKVDDKLKGAQFNFTGGMYTAKVGEEIVRQGTYSIDVAASAIDLKPAAGPFKGKTLSGSYKVDGSSLKICAALPGKDRPKDFSSAEGSGQILLVLERPKK